LEAKQSLTTRQQGISQRKCLSTGRDKKINKSTKGLIGIAQVVTEQDSLGVAQ
ncbi:MAG: hypothetical protein RLZZ300_1416, partial [Pseudomonadota bacterium]